MRAALGGGFLAYTAFWSYVSLAKLYTLRATVFDLGVNMQYAWVAVHSSQAVPHFAATRGLVYLVAPIFLAGGYPAVLVFQSAFIGAGIFPLYSVARSEIGERPALLLSLSYLVYFPVSGMNWFDFHYQALFPTLFLLGWYFFRIRKAVSLSFLFFALSALSHYPYSVFAGLLGLVLLFDARKKVRGALSLSVLLITFSLFTLFFAIFELGVAGATTGSVTVPGVSKSELVPDMLTLFLILLPVLFLPLLSRWSLFLLPYTLLLVVSGSPYFAYPLVFGLQYPALFVCFVFLGASGGIAKLGSTQRRRMALSLFLLFAVCTSAVFFAPYGPLNRRVSFNFASLSAQPGARYRTLETELSLVKPGSVVLVENDMPEAFPGKEGITPVDTLYLSRNFLNRTQPDYVLADLNSSWFTSPGVENATMQQMFDELWKSGNYSIVAEGSGLVLIKRGEAGVSYYTPEDALFLSSSFETPSGKGRMPINVSQPDEAPKIMWYGPYTYLVPGLFNLSFELDSLASRGSVLLQVTADYGRVLLAQYPLNLSVLQGRWRRVSFVFYARSAYTAVEFRALGSDMNGNLLFREATLAQVAQALPRFPDSVYPGYALMHSPAVSVNKEGWLNLTGAGGIVWYGPYTDLSAGNYTLEFGLQGANLSSGQGLTLEVTANSGSLVLARQTLNATALDAMGNVSLSFSLNRSYTGVEFRGVAQKTLGRLYLVSVTLLRLENPPHLQEKGSVALLSAPMALLFPLQVRKRSLRTGIGVRINKTQTPPARAHATASGG